MGLLLCGCYINFIGEKMLLFLFCEYVVGKEDYLKFFVMFGIVLLKFCILM